MALPLIHLGSHHGVDYALNDEGWLDMDMVRDAALKHRPKLIICGASLIRA